MNRWHGGDTWQGPGRKARPLFRFPRLFSHPLNPPSRGLQPPPVPQLGGGEGGMCLVHEVSPLHCQLSIHPTLGTW